MSRPGTAAAQSPGERLRLIQRPVEVSTAAADDQEGSLQERSRSSPCLLDGRTAKAGSPSVGRRPLDTPSPVSVEDAINRRGSFQERRRGTKTGSPSDGKQALAEEAEGYRRGSLQEGLKKMQASSPLKMNWSLRPGGSRKQSLPTLGAKGPAAQAPRRTAFQLPKLEHETIVNAVFFTANGPSYMTLPSKRRQSLSSTSPKGQEGAAERQRKPGAASASPARVTRASSAPGVTRDMLRGDVQLKAVAGNNALQEHAKDSHWHSNSFASTEAPVASPIDREVSMDSDDDLLVPSNDNGPGDEKAPEEKEPGIDWYTWEFLDNDDDLRMRTTFRRFADMGVAEVPQERLYELIAHMGYMNATPQLVQQFAKETCQFTMMDFLDFREVVERFVKHERQIVRKRVASWVESTKDCTFQALLSFLRTLGRVVTKEVLEEAVTELGVELGGRVHVETVLRLLGFFRLREGFTHGEVDRLLQIFEDLSSLNPSAPQKFSPRASGSSKSRRTSSLIKASDLLRGLFDYAGPYLFETVLKLLEKVSCHDSAPSVPFCEFMAWARCLRDLSMQELWDSFTKVDVNGARAIDVGAIHILALDLGFTLSGDAIQEMLANLGLDRRESLDFDDVVHLMNECRRCHGFAKEEEARLLTVYEKFDYNGDGDLDPTECLDMIRYIGCTTRIDVVQAFIKKYDFDQDGKMGMTEFLRLMRFQREQEMQEVRGAYHQSSRGHRMLAIRNLPKALNLLGQHPRPEVLEELLSAEGHPQVMPLEVFARIADRCREVVTKERRRHAGFDSDIFQQLTEVFESKAEPPLEEGAQRLIRLGQLLRMLAECDIPVNTTDGRQALLKAIEEARGSAVEAGLDKKEVGEPGSPEVPYWTFIHLVRGLVREKQVVVMNGETEALQRTRFSTIEVEQFRKIFTSMAQDIEKEEAPARRAKKRWTCLKQHVRSTRGEDISMSRTSGRKSILGHAGSKEEAMKRMSLKELIESITAVPTLPQYAITRVLQSIGLRVSLLQLDELKEKVRSLAACRDLDLSCFLQLMRWMLDTNFANINGTTKRAVERLKQQTP